MLSVHRNHPFTLPSAGDHILLVGTATSAFCNYWAKIFVSLVHGQPVHRREESGPIPSRMTLEAVSNAVKLALYYGHTGTVLGHGVLWSDPQWFAPRMEYVTAMEMFVLSHEYGHCIAEEASDRYRGMLSAEMSRELELLCDRMGTAIAKLAGTNGGWVAYCGDGATLMIYASAICERARDLYGGARTSTACTHPPARDRIAVIRAQVLSTTPPDQLAAVISFLDDLTALCEELKQVVVEILEDMAARHTTSRVTILAPYSTVAPARSSAVSSAEVEPPTVNPRAVFLEVSVRPRSGRKLLAALECGGPSWQARAAVQPGSDGTACRS